MILLASVSVSCGTKYNKRPLNKNYNVRVNETLQQETGGKTKWMKICVLENPLNVFMNK